MIDFQTTGLEELIHGLEEMERRHQTLMIEGAHEVHGVFLKAEERLFNTQGGSGGRRWAPLASSTRRYKRGGRINERTGELRRSLTQARHPMHVFRVSPDSIEMGTRLRYAKYVHAKRPVIQATQKDADDMAHVLGERLFEERMRRHPRGR